MQVEVPLFDFFETYCNQDDSLNDGLLLSVKILCAVKPTIHKNVHARIWNALEVLCSQEGESEGQTRWAEEAEVLQIELNSVPTFGEFTEG